MSGVTLLTRGRLQENLLNISFARSKVGIAPQRPGFQICGTVPSEVDMFALDPDRALRSAVEDEQTSTSLNSSSNLTRYFEPLSPGTVLCTGLHVYSTLLFAACFRFPHTGCVQHDAIHHHTGLVCLLQHFR